MPQETKVFEYVAILEPTVKEAEDGKKAEIIVKPDVILAKDENSAKTAAAMGIPEEYRDRVDQITVLVRPFTNR